MGQNNGAAKVEQPPTLEQINNNIEELFGRQFAADKVDSINEPIIIISRNLSEEGSFSQKQTGFHANPILLKCVYHPNFEKTLKNLVSLLTKELKTILDSRFLAMVPREQFRRTLNIANFCIFFTNQNVIQTINLLSIRSDLESTCKQLVLELSKDSPEINQQIIESIDNFQLSEITKVLRVSMRMMIDLHLKLITRSDFTLKIVDRLNQSIFVLYCKIYFAQIHEIHKKENKENAKNLLKIGSYFLGLGLHTKTAPIYELAILLLTDVINNNKDQLINQKALPSHLFKSLPVISNNEMMHWLTNNILFTLTFKKEGNSVFNRININRIPSYKLLTLLFQNYKPHDHQITYLLEEICLQTKAFQIQRVYVAEIAQLYSTLQATTEIIKRFANLTHISYNIKGIKKQVKVKPEDVRTQLEDDQDSFRKEMLSLCSKYTIQVIFQKQQVYDYSDKALWNVILYQLEEEGAELKEKEQEIEQPQDDYKMLQEKGNRMIEKKEEIKTETIGIRPQKLQNKPETIEQQVQLEGQGPQADRKEEKKENELEVKSEQNNDQ